MLAEPLVCCLSTRIRIQSVIRNSLSDCGCVGPVYFDVRLIYCDDICCCCCCFCHWKVFSNCYRNLAKPIRWVSQDKKQCDACNLFLTFFSLQFFRRAGILLCFCEISLPSKKHFQLMFSSLMALVRNALKDELKTTTLMDSGKDVNVVTVCSAINRPAASSSQCESHAKQMLLISTSRAF